MKPAAEAATRGLCVLFVGAEAVAVMLNGIVAFLAISKSASCFQLKARAAFLAGPRTS